MIDNDKFQLSIHNHHHISFSPVVICHQKSVVFINFWISAYIICFRDDCSHNQMSACGIAHVGFDWVVHGRLHHHLWMIYWSLFALKIIHWDQGQTKLDGFSLRQVHSQPTPPHPTMITISNHHDKHHQQPSVAHRCLLGHAPWAARRTSRRAVLARWEPWPTPAWGCYQQMIISRS